jgi:restriction endonuclease S subunit
MQLNQVANVVYGTRVTKKKDGGSKYPVYGGGGETFRLNNFNREDCTIVSRFAMSAKCVRYVKGEFFLNDSGLTVETATSDLDQNFLDEFLFSKMGEIYSLGRGTAQKNLDVDSFKKMPVPVPPLAAQLRIAKEMKVVAAALESQYAEVAQQREAAKRLAGAILSKKLQNIDGAMIVKLKDIADLKGRIGWRGLTAKEYVDEGPRFLSVHSLNYGHYVNFRDAFHITQERYDESPEIMLQKNDILICKDGAGIGKLAVMPELLGPTTINSSLLLIRPRDTVYHEFLYLYLLSPMFQAIVQERLSGSTTPHLYQRDIAELKVELPPFDIQQRVVTEIWEAFAQQENIIELADQKQQTLINLRDSFFRMKLREVEG